MAGTKGGNQVSATKDRMTHQERAFSARYPNFYAALMSLGQTNDERAQALGLKRRAFHDVKQGMVSLKASRLELHPTLAEAWYRDVSALRGTEKAA
jgi:hypothetical protein